MKERARSVVLLSGGLDSATALFWSVAQGHPVRALTVDYGQRHQRELRSARALARAAGVELCRLRLNLPWLKISALVDRKKKLPDVAPAQIGRGIPSTYVPGRNTLFLALGLSWAESCGARALVIGANVLDYSGYPDCRPRFLRAFERLSALGTRQGVGGRAVRVLAPLIKLNKAQIISWARRLGVPLELTWSCYAGGRFPCRRCDSCKLRARGFEEAGWPDPLAS